MRLPILRATASLLAFLGPATALAQTPCPSPDDDAFVAARRSRRIVSDYTDLRGIHRADMARNAELYTRQTGEPMPWRFALAGVVDWSRTFGYDVCTEQGPSTGSFQPLRLGAILTVEIERIGLELEGFALLVQDRLVLDPTPDQTRGPNGEIREPTGLANVFTNESMFGGRVSAFDWVTVVGAYIVTAETQNVRGDDGRALVVGDVGGPGDRAYLAAGIPRWHLFANILFDADDLAADTLGLDVEDVPLPWAALRLSAGAGWIEDESQLTLAVKVSEILELFSLELGLEHRPVALRYARARVDWGVRFGEDPPEGRVAPEDAQPRLGFDLETFAELSWFGSRYLEERTGDGGAVGAWFGVTARPDLTILMAQLDLFFGVNRPEAIDRLVQAAGHWQVGLRLHGRFGL